VASYVKTWEKRCYSDGIPDEAPNKLLDSGRVPSYKTIALAILRNDYKFLGIVPECSEWAKILKQKDDKQRDLFEESYNG